MSLVLLASLVITIASCAITLHFSAKLKAVEAELSKFATSEFSEAKILIARIRAVL